MRWGVRKFSFSQMVPGGAAAAARCRGPGQEQQVLMVQVPTAVQVLRLFGVGARWVGGEGVLV